MANTVKLSHAEIREYALNIDATRFPYFCAATGELAESLAYVVCTSIRDFCRYGIAHRWKISKAWQG